MRLGNYLVEGRSRSITYGKLFDLIKSNFHDAAMNFIKNWKGKDNLIYRSLSNDDPYLFVDPLSSNERTSPYAVNNVYNLLFSNLPSWKIMPKRNKSIICGTDYDRIYERSRDDGGLYIVFPENGAKIGICPEYDIWFSFKNINRSFSNLNNFNRLISRWIDIVLEEDIEDENYSSLVRQLEHFDREIYLKVNNEEDINYLNDDMLSTLNFIGYDYENGDNFIKLLDKLLDPKKNDFMLYRYSSSTSLPSDNEIWTDGKCLLINYDEAEEVYNEINNLFN